MKRLILFASFVFVSVFTVGESAAEQDDLFNKLDTDRSGIISREEFVSCPLVRTKDGRIQHRELCTDPDTALSVEEKQRLYDKIDQDKAGAVTRKKLNRFATPDGFAPIRF